MALIEEYVVLADQYPVDPNLVPDIVEGDCVRLSTAGYAVLATNTGHCIGIAADSSLATGGHTAYAADLVIGAHANFGDPAKTRSTSNRVSDMYNETLASGKMTVYNGGGKFHTDRYETSSGGTPVTYAYGNLLYPSTNGKLLNNSNSSNAPLVGILSATPRDYPSGVPGVETTDGSMSLGSFLTISLRI